MKEKILIILFLLFFFKIYAQALMCGTSTPINYETYENINRTYDNSNNNIIDINALPVCINVYYHIVRKSDGSGGFDPSSLNEITNILNQSYNPINVYINSIGFDYIDNSRYYELYNISNYFDPLVQINRRTDAINIYIVGNFPGISGMADGIPSNALVVTNGTALSNVISHELGHCLNLLHTHETYYGIENIPRTGPNANCDTAGDLLCDTPADPGLLNNVNSSCVYTGGGGYTPDTHNIMSYTNDNCRESFTYGQMIRMKDAIANSPVLQNVVGSECQISDIIGNNNFCNNQQITFSIDNVYPPYNWSTSPNLQILSGNGTDSIVVESINNGSGFVEVSYFAGKSKINIYVGSINEGIDNFMIMDDGPLVKVLTKDDNGNEIQWKVNNFNIQNPTNNFWMEIDLANYSDYCINNQTILSMRQIGICGWSEYDSRYYDCYNEDEWYSIPPPYPNTANENFKIDFSNKPDGYFYEISLYDNNQNLKFQGTSDNIEKTINTLSLPNGRYFLIINSNGNIKTKQIIINH